MDRVSNESLEQLTYLTEPLAQVTRRHLADGERVLMAVFLDRISHYRREQLAFGRAYEHRERLPRRAFVLTEQHLLVLEDPRDPAVSKADEDFPAVVCPFERMIAFEVRSHLLDCSLTLAVTGGHIPPSWYLSNTTEW